MKAGPSAPDGHSATRTERLVSDGEYELLRPHLR